MADEKFNPDAEYDIPEGEFCVYGTVTIPIPSLSYDYHRQKFVDNRLASDIFSDRSTPFPSTPTTSTLSTKK